MGFCPLGVSGCFWFLLPLLPFSPLWGTSGDCGLVLEHWSPSSAERSYLLLLRLWQMSLLESSGWMTQPGIVDLAHTLKTQGVSIL